MGVRPGRAFTIGSTIVAVAALTTGASLADTSAPAQPRERGHSEFWWPKLEQDVQVLALNDLHGNLEPAGEVGDQPAGGAEYLASHLDELRDGHRWTTTVAAGDLIGASPLLSAAFYDEPTIEALSAMDLDAASVGNHEFDAGWQELLRKQNGGCKDTDDPNRDSCPDPQAPFEGAGFDYLSANVFHEDNGDTLLPPYTIERFGPSRIAFIGMTLEDTPNIVTAESVEGLEFTDEVETANALVPKLKRRGVDSIVVLLHEGGFSADPDRYNDCPEISGPVVDIAENLDPEIDAVISGHTHEAYNCSIPDPDGEQRLVTSASSYGSMLTEINLTIDLWTGDVVRDATQATNHVVDHEVAKDAEMTELIAKYGEYVKPIESQVIGHLTGSEVTSEPDDSHESPLGNLIADSMLTDESVVTGGEKPTVAFMNPGGIRADLVAEDGDNAITYGSAFAVQPFGNYLVSMDLTGAQLLELLEQQWTGDNAGGADAWKVLQVAGMSYTWQPGGDSGQVVDGSVEVNGEALDTSATYRVVTNSFLADGGDGFPTFTEGENVYFGGLDIDAMSTYLEANDPYDPMPTDRIDVR